MATLELPSANDTEAFEYETELQGSVFQLSFRWNRRDAHWFLTVRDADGVDIASGRRVVADWPLLKGVVDVRRPHGEIVALDTTGEGDPGLTDLGGRVLLLYEEG